MDLLKKMLEIYSPSGQEATLAHLLRDEMTRRGFQTHIDSVGNVIGQIGHGSINVYLVGHMDTVSGQIPVRIESGKLYGRGAVDAKGPLAAFIEAASAFNEKLSLTVIGCVGEEADSVGAHFLISPENPERHEPHFIIIGEPSGWDAITLGYKGSISLSYRQTQERHHGGHFQLTAAERAIALYQQLKAQYGAQPRSFDSIDVNLLAINTVNDGLYENAEMDLNLRTPLGFDLSAFQEFTKNIQDGAQLELGEITPAFKADKRNALVRSFLQSIRALDGQPTFKTKTGTSDMNLLGPTWGVPILAYGPGDSSLDHTPHEHLRLDEYENAVAVLGHALETLTISESSAVRRRSR